MSLESVEQFFAEHAPDIVIIEAEASTAIRIEPERMASLVNAQWVDVSQTMAD